MQPKYAVIYSRGHWEWSEKELSLVKEWAGKVPTKEIAERLERSNASIYHAYIKLGISYVSSNKKEIVLGTKFGRLTVLSFSHIGPYQMAYWNCRCECGQEKTVQGASLRSGSTVSCGCYRPFEDLIGQVFGFWTVLGRAYSKKIVSWHCQCTCGKISVISSYGLKNGQSTKCKSCATAFCNRSFMQLCAEVNCDNIFEAKTPHAMFCEHHRGQKKREVHYRKRNKSRAYAILGNRCANPNCGWINEDGTRGCTDRRCMNVDHVNSDGAADRKNGKASNRALFYNKVLKNPERFQLLCCNCNWIKRHTHHEVVSNMD